MEPYVEVLEQNNLDIVRCHSKGAVWHHGDIGGLTLTKPARGSMTQQ